MDQDLERRIRAQAEQQQGPFYLYDAARIHENARRFLAIPYDPKSICFATMANAHPRFLRTVREAGLQIFVNSVQHLDLAIEAGSPGEEIVFTASAMDERTMARVHEVGAVLNLDSTGQLGTWWRLFPDAPVGIRCNIGTLVTPRKTHGGYFLGPESRLGLSVEEIQALAGTDKIRGLHLYLGTDIQDLEYFYECYKHIVRLARLFPALQFLDFGGGFGVSGDRRFDFHAYGAFVTRLMKSVSREAGRTVRLILEPGRIIGADTAWFVCRVTDVKHRAGRQLIGVDASAAQFARPLLYPEDARHPADVLPANPSRPLGELCDSAVYGCSTYSRDFLARDVMLAPAELGDLVVLGHAGAYSASSHSRFLGFPPAAEIFE